jgi:hypothetical protein
MKIDLDKANAAIDEYVAKLKDPDIPSRRVSSSYWQKFCLERHGVIPDARKLDLLDHCVLFTACIIACKRVREVSRLEVEHRAVHPGRSLQKTLNLVAKKKDQPWFRRLERHLADTNETPSIPA